MEEIENQRETIWRGINHWMKHYNLTPSFLSQSLAGTRPPYMPGDIARGIKDGSVQITSDLLHRCVRLFRLVNARGAGSVDNLSDEECITLIITPIMKDSGQGKFQL